MGAVAAHKRPPKPVIALVVLTLLGLGGWWWWSSQHAATATAAGLNLSGTVQTREYQVAPAIVGRITAVNVAEGDQVTKGEPLVTLDKAALDLQVKQAQEGVRAAKAAVTNAKDDGSKADVAAARARQAQAESAVALAKLQRSYATITAPHDGTVVTVVANVGQNASPGRTLITLTDPADAFVRVFVPEPSMGQVKVGQPVKVVVDGSTTSYDGTVSYLATQAEFTPNNVDTKDQRAKLVFEVRVRVTDSGGTLKSGMPVDVSFQ